MKIYLSGPMTGHPDLNFPRFHAVAYALRCAGYEVVNPAELNPDTTDWATCMRRDIAALTECNAIVMLMGYHSSQGAMLELHVARELGLTVYGIRTLLALQRDRIGRDALTAAMAHAA